jgi:hypothetical protein
MNGCIWINCGKYSNISSSSATSADINNSSISVLSSVIINTLKVRNAIVHADKLLSAYIPSVSTSNSGHDNSNNNSNKKDLDT